MESPERIVGIDVAQAELVVAVDPSPARTREIGRWTNDAAGWAALRAHLAALSPTLIVLEGTGGLEVGIAAELYEAELPVVVVNPRRVRAFAYSDGRLAKTDPIDAAVLARFGAVLRPAVRPRPDAAARELRALVVRRRQVRDLRTDEKNRLARAPEAVRASIRRMTAMLTAELTDLERAIAAALAGDPTRAATARVLRSAPGIGPVIAATLVAELPELGQIGDGPVAALVGVAPITRQSGRSTRPAAIAGGRSPVRTALYLAAVTAVRCNPRFTAYYEHLLARHKPRKVALIACAHKLLTILNAMLRDGTMWQDPPVAAPIAA
jgi:transposase